MKKLIASLFCLTLVLIFIYNVVITLCYVGLLFALSLC